MTRGEFTMPSLGADMDEGKLVEWRVAPGDVVHRGDLVAVVETSKAAVEVEVWEDGVVAELLVQPGTVVPVGAVLARLTPLAGEALAGTPAVPAAASAPAAPAAASAPAAPAAASAPAAPAAAPAPTPAPAPVATPAPPVPAPAAVVAPVPAPAAAAPPPAPTPAPAGGRVLASPYARRRARELGVDLSRVRGSGRHGVIVGADVEAAGQAGVAAPVPAPAEAGPPADPARARALAMREAIARAMARSKREIPHYYLSMDVDLGPALDWLQGQNASRPLAERILPAALLLKAVAAGVAAVPEVNGFFREGGFVPGPGVHLGVAISLREGGLIAPALLDVDQKPLGQVMAELRDLVERTRTGTLRGRELSDATLTVTNLGDQGVGSVHGVIYPPQVALVGVGKIAPRPWVVRDQLAVRPVVTLSLAADHRVSDGHRGGRFLAAVAKHLQRPETL